MFKHWCTRTAIGIHVADNEIDFVVLQKKRMHLHVLARRSVFLPEGTVYLGRIQNKKALRQAFAKAFHVLGAKAVATKHMVFSIPESQIYTHIAFLNKKDERSYDEQINEVLEENIPIRSEHLVYTTQRRKHERKGDNVLIAAVEDVVVQEWYEFFEELGHHVSCFDIEALANVRSIMHGKPSQPLAVIDIGSWTTHLAVFDKLGLQHTHTIKSAGTVFTCHLAEKLGISIEEAEDAKKKHGVSGSDKEIKEALLHVVNPIIEEVRDTLAYVEDMHQEKIEDVILIGGSSHLPGLKKHMKSLLKRRINFPDAPLLKDTRKGSYSAALGAALRGVDKTLMQKDIAFYMFDRKKKEEKKHSKEVHHVFGISLHAWVWVLAIFVIVLGVGVLWML